MPPSWVTRLYGAPCDAPSSDLARTYLQRLLEMRRNEASNLLYAAVHGEVPVEDIYLHVFQPVQHELGRMWQHGEISVAVERELHELGTRMVGDFFELAGWDTVYLGANTTVQSIVHDAVRDVIRTVRGLPERKGTIVLVGGAPFNRDPELWSRVGGDGGGRDAEQAVSCAHALLAARDEA